MSLLSLLNLLHLLRHNRSCSCSNSLSRFSTVRIVTAFLIVDFFWTSFTFYLVSSTAIIDTILHKLGPCCPRSTLTSLWNSIDYFRSALDWPCMIKLLHSHYANSIVECDSAILVTWICNLICAVVKPWSLRVWPFCALVLWSCCALVMYLAVVVSVGFHLQLLNFGIGAASILVGSSVLCIKYIDKWSQSSPLWR